MQDLIDTINTAFEARADITAATVSPTVREAVEQALALLDAGTTRVAEPTTAGWQVNEWLKKAVLLSFRIRDNRIMPLRLRNSHNCDSIRRIFDSHINTKV